MRSTFMGLETARRGMTTHQHALETTGHNISNANTPGYTRQRVNFTATEAYPGGHAVNRPELPGQLGTGVKAGSVQRVRESFLDDMYRGENSQLGFWSAQAEALSRMEEIMNEPSDTGLAKVLDLFWQSLEDLSVNPNDSGARSVVRERGIAVADTFKYVNHSLTRVQNDIVNEIGEIDNGGVVDEMNSIARQLHRLNNEIGRIEPNGYLPNDLYDERDRLLDRLSELVDIETDIVESGGRALDIAEGKFTVSIVDRDGNKQTLVNGEELSNDPNELSVRFENGEATITLAGNNVQLNEQKGRLSGLLKMHGEYSDMIANLDVMASAFITEFNRVHRLGKDLQGDDGGDFFTGTSAANISLHDGLVANEGLTKIAVSLDGTVGNGENALNLAEVKNKPLEMNDTENTIEDFYKGLIGQMAIKAQEAKRMNANSETLRLSVDERRQSISGVSIDEEVIDLMRFQHAYNASARMVTVVDEVLNRIINGMGIVGR